MLIAYSKWFPELTVGIDRVAAGLQAEGDLLLKSADTAASIERYTKALEALLDNKPELVAREANLRARIGFALFLRSDFDNAASQFIGVLRLQRQVGSENPGRMLGEISRQLVNNPKQCWELQDAWNAIGRNTRDRGLVDDLVAAAKALRESVVDWLEHRKDSQPELQLPIVTPILMEIGSGLIPDDTTENWSLRKSYIPDMRSHLESEMGVPLPGVRIRSNDNLQSDGYSLALDEQPIVSGRAPVHSRFCPAPAHVLEALGIPTVALTVATNPLTRKTGCWVPHEHWRPSATINSNCGKNRWFSWCVI